MKPEAHRIECKQGHVVAMTKSGDEDVEDSVISHFGTCMYCGAPLEAFPTTVEEYHRWATREDGRHMEMVTR